MTLERIDEFFDDFSNAVERLREALNGDFSLTSLVVDGTIQRFEFTFELSWKLANAILENNNVFARWPRMVIKEAFKFGLIKEGQGWLEMLEDRNKTSHIYDEKQALGIYERIKNKHLNFLIN
ncbi:MAG: HI0074 family nucleotidyltransferase substrate-binding subunit [Candidatus Omnitrophota bacterium]|nr:nucleotidyltransferase substrate binding protein [Candidatus Omnitrophota bacterium]